VAETADGPTPDSEPVAEVIAEVIAEVMDVPPHASDEQPYVACVLPSPTQPFDWRSPEVAQAVANIAAAEGPVSERVVCKRLAEAWGLKRSPVGFAQALPSLLRRIATSLQPTWRAGYLWPAGTSPEQWSGYRIFDPAEPHCRRDTEDIPVEEIANAASALLSRYGRMPRADLARALAKRFGFRGLTKTVGQRMEEGLALADERAQAKAAIS
jgi:hypothetical protein